MRTCLALLISGILLCGCIDIRYVKIPERYPVYTMPPKAKVEKVSTEDLAPLSEETRTKVVNTVKELKGEAAYLRTILEKYNEYADERNKDFYDYIKGK